jgi:RNA polymerase sigma-70 factor (ECF subfamily)
MTATPSYEQELIDRFANGESNVVGELIELHRDRIKRMIQVRLDPGMRQRLDSSDVFQELQIDVIKRMPEFIPQQQEVSFFQWLRFLGRQKLAELHRRHVGAQARSINREYHPASDASSIALANFLVGDVSSPSLQVSRKELKQCLDSAVGALEELDREAILLRHAEQLSAIEAAAELGIAPNAFRQRYFRALKKLKASLEKHQLLWG